MDIAIDKETEKKLTELATDWFAPKGVPPQPFDKIVKRLVARAYDEFRLSKYRKDTSLFS